MKHTLKTLLLLTSLFVLVYSCKKESDDSSAPPTTTGSGTMTTTISGRAIDESNNAVSNATVIISGQTTTTDQYGIFLLKNISVSSRCIASITKAGFFNCNHAFTAKANTVNYIKVVLLSNAQTHTISSSAGGTAPLSDGSSIQFAPNSFVVASSGAAYSGTVYLSVKHLSPDAPNFGFMIPGGDLLGKNTAGNDVALYTYGMLGAELKGSSGEQLQLTTSTTATLTMSIASSQTATAPTSIPLWYFDEATSLWKEEGSAARVGNNYVGTVAHFSWWNCDYQGPRASITGKVLDCNSVPMPNVTVTVNGWYTTMTNQGGVYSDWLPVGMPFTVQVLASNNNNLFLNSQVENVPILSANQNYIVPDLIVPCPARISGTLKTCQGINTDGRVTATWAGGGCSFQYSSTGNFNLVCPASSTIDINASGYHNSFLFTFSGQYPAPAAGNTNNIGDVLLCNQVSTFGNNFTINGGPFSNQLFVVDTNTTYTIDNGSSYSLCISGTSQSYNVNSYRISVNALAVGSYNWSGIVVHILFTDGTHTYSADAYPPPGSTQITYAGNIGDRVIGNFSGMGVLGEDSVSSYPMTFSGNFDITRTQ